MEREFWGRFIIHIPQQIWQQISKSERIKLFLEQTKGYVITEHEIYFVPILYLEGQVISKYIEVDITMAKSIPVGEDIHIVVKPYTKKGNLIQTDNLALVEAKSEVGLEKFYIEFTTRFKKYQQPYQPSNILQERVIKYKGKEYRYGTAKL